jgi:hypothetical protein
MYDDDHYIYKLALQPFDVLLYFFRLFSNGGQSISVTLDVIIQLIIQTTISSAQSKRSEFAVQQLC